jgi:hypothetical protein
MCEGGQKTCDPGQGPTCEPLPCLHLAALDCVDQLLLGDQDPTLLQVQQETKDLHQLGGLPLTLHLLTHPAQSLKGQGDDSVVNMEELILC